MKLSLTSVKSKARNAIAGFFLTLLLPLCFSGQFFASDAIDTEQNPLPAIHAADTLDMEKVLVVSP
ncbi:MAG: hypothetical protein AAGI38_13365 [Bacteroidota bacterium]